MANTIVVGMDLSPQSMIALEEAVPIARHRGAKIVIVHAEPTPMYALGFEGMGQGLVAQVAKVNKAHLAEVRRVLADIEQRHRGQGVDISVSLHPDEANVAIVEAAEKFDAELVVVGAHGIGAIDRLLIGSVSERVVRAAPCDVLVSQDRHPKGRYDRILVPTDYSATARKAVSVAQDLLSDDGTITLLHCCEMPPMMAGYYTGDILGEIEAQAVKRAEEIAAPLREAGIHVQVQTFRGPPAHSIGKVAEDNDIVVIGSHGRRGLRRFFLGSVAEKTVRYAQCSVYVVRAPESEEES